MNLNTEEIIASLAIKYEGDWDNIYKGLLNPQDRDLENYFEVVKTMKCKYVTILSPEYPDYFKYCFKPPFVLFYYGDIKLLSQIGKTC